MIDRSVMLNLPVLDEYLEAFRLRDVSRCVAFYAEGAILEFGGTYCRDRPCLEKWHRERFASNLSVLQIGNAAVNGGIVTVDGVVSSDRLATWGVAPISGQATFNIRDGKIAEARFGLKTGPAGTRT
jgi:hypothetical protein